MCRFFSFSSNTIILALILSAVAHAQNLEDFKDALKKVQSKHEKAGYLSADVKRERDKLYKDMISLAKAKFVNFNDVNKAL